MNSTLARLRDRLAEYRRRLLAGIYTRSLIQVLCVQLLLVPLLAWMSYHHPYDAVWLQAILATCILYLWPFFQGWRKRRGSALQPEQLAERLDRFNPEAPDVFRTLLSLENHNPETVAALDRFYAGWENRLHIPPVPLAGRVHSRLLVLCLLFAIVLPALSGHFGGILYRMALPISAWNKIPVPRLDPGDFPERMALGDTLRIPVRVEQLPVSEPVYALVRFHGKEERYPLERRGDTAWFRDGPVQGDLILSFSALRVKTSEHLVHAVPPPYLRSFSAVLQPPAYTRLPAESLSEVPATLTLLPGTHVAWHARSSQKLETVQAIFTPRDAPPETLNLGSGNEFVFKGIVRKPTGFRLRLKTSDGLVGHAGPYQVEPGVDAPPEITLLSPSADGELSRSLKVPLLFRTHDDYGISQVTLHYSIPGGQQGAATSGIKGVTSWLQGGSGMGGGIWDLGDLPLSPGKVVEMYLEAADNDAVSGFKTARSQIFHLRMPSLEEVLAGVNAGESSAITSLKSAAEREEKIQRDPGQSATQQQSDAPPPLGSWEVRRILNSAPQDHLQRLQKHLEAEAARANKDSPLAKQVESIRKEAKEMEKSLPPPDAWQKSISEQKKWLDTLMRNQQKLDQHLSELKPLPPPAEPRQQDPLALERKSLQEELKRNQGDQQDLKSWLKDQEQDQNARKQDRQQAAQSQERAREDVKQAISQIQQTLQKGMENGVISPDMLKKMERIQELLKEAMSENALQHLQEDAQNQQVGVEDLQRNLKDLIDQQKDMHQGLDRAIHMLEMLRDMHALENLAGDVHELQSRQEQLAEQIPEQKKNSGKDEQLEGMQSELRERLENTAKKLEQLAREQKAFQNLKDQAHAHEAGRKMEEAGNDLKKDSPKRSEAKQKAKSAADELKKVADGMDGMLAKMQGGPDPSEIAEVLDETLEFGRWLTLVQDRNLRVREGWSEEDAALGQRAGQLSHWLRGRMEKLAARQPFESDVLRREAVAMTFQADALMTQNTFPASDSLVFHTRKAARELLKWLKQANDDEGSDEGEGSGSGSASGGKKSGKGKGQSEGDEEGLDGLAGRLRGVSGKQMAVNQATYQLLRSMLDGRRSGQGSQSGSLPMPGGQSSSSGQGSSAQGGGNQPGGASGNGSREGGNSPGGTAGSQQGIGESLERMAESANDAGGAARKLRQLAEEARSLEKDLREGRADPEEIRRKQERFQTRLLESANAMEERGQDRERQAEAYRGGSLKSDSNGTPSSEDVFRELRRRRDWARELALPTEQKRRLELYYENLLTR